MAARLTDRQKQKIIADYVELGSYNAVAKMNGTSNHTVRRIVLEVPELSEKIQKKKEENTADILAYMESQKKDICEVLSIGISELKKPGRFERATPPQIATTMAILIDKYASISGSSPNGGKEDGLSQSLRELGQELEGDE